MIQNNEKLKNWLLHGLEILDNMEDKNISSENFKLFLKFFRKFNQKLNRKKPLLFVIVNEGVHPILPTLKEQFGDDIQYEILTTGNTGLNEEKKIAEKCKTIGEKYRQYNIYLVPSGFPYMAVTAFNVLQQTLARYPTWLQYDRESRKYIEKNLDPRALTK